MEFGTNGYSVHMTWFFEESFAPDVFAALELDGWDYWPVNGLICHCPDRRIRSLGKRFGFLILKDAL